MKKLEIFNYDGNNITFDKNDDSIMVNATQMAKSFNKRPSKWLELPTTETFLNELEAVRKSDRLNLINSVNGVGTWMHEDVALEFARWLNPRFAIWCNDKIKELLKTGHTQFNNSDEDQAILQAMNILQNRVVMQTEQLKLQAPKVHYVDEVLQSANTYTTTQIAKELGLGAPTLNRMLQDNYIQYKQSNTWLLYAKYQSKGYTKTKTTVFTGTDGETKTSMLTVWTERGRAFIHYTFKNNKI